MYNFLLRNGTTIAFVVGFIAAVVLVVAVVGGGSEYAYDDHVNLYGVGAFGTAVKIGVAFVVLGLIAIAVGGIYGLVTNPKSAIKFVIGGAVLAVMVGILFAISPEETSGPVRALNEEYDIQGTTTRLISGGILATVILLGLAFATVLLAEIRNAFK